MKNPIIVTCKTCLFLCLALMPGRVQAASLLLDFGPTTVAGTDTTLSMGHFAGALSATDISWNKIINADATSGLLYADGSAATGISVIVGRSGAGISDAINYSTKLISSSALGGQETWGIYTNTSPIKDGIFATGTSTVNTNAVGIRVDGLAAGTYTLYISGRNTSTATTAPQRFFAANGASSSSFSFSTNSTSFVDEVNSGTTSGTPTQADAITSTFAYGDNCAHLVVTLGSGDSLYLAATGIASDTGYRGFLNSVEIVAGAPVLTNFPATIGGQPKGVTVYEGATVNLGGAKFGGVPPLFYQWYSNSVPITGATNTILTLSNVSASAAGNYTVAVSNEIAVAVSSNAVLNVVPLYNTGQMTNLWNLLPGDRFYLTTVDGGERGLAFNPVTANLLVVCHQPTNNIVVLDPATGAEKYFMNLAFVPATSLGVNMIGVADDGAVYTCGATANASSPSTPFYLIKWADDGVNTIASGYAFSGDPGSNDATVGANALRWGDNFAVRGAGLDTQLLCGPGSGTNVCLFTTADGSVFTPNIITVSDVPSGFAQFGISFGPGTNTFWAKTLNQGLYLVQFDLAAKTGSVIYSSTNGLPGTFRFISTGGTNKWMAGIMKVASGLPDNVRLYDISSLTNGVPVLADQELNPTNNGNAFLNGAGAGSTAFGGNYLFSLEINNGIRAFQIDPNYTPALPPFSIISITPLAGPSLTLTWQSVANHAYQVQSKASLTDPTWTDVGSSITASGTTTSATNNVSDAAQFYRVLGN
ncbi:MAG TPA: immunoglobulin domain-containing protein [bacterium]|nr:immunoglobulin domain-containing protein [bacterium]